MAGPAILAPLPFSGEGRNPASAEHSALRASVWAPAFAGELRRNG